MSPRYLLPSAAALLAMAGCTVHTGGRATNTAGGPDSSKPGTTGGAEQDAQQQDASAGASGQSSIRVRGLTTATGMSELSGTCTQGGSEQCNGMDDNCNGEIDEGCGYSSGEVQVTLSWATEADVDMYITDPSGETISYQSPKASSGGHLDHDARGACRPNDEDNQVENAYWGEKPPKGAYEIEVHYYGECNSGAGPTDVTLSISGGGQVLGTWEYRMSPGERVGLASFEVQ